MEIQYRLKESDYEAAGWMNLRRQWLRYLYRHRRIALFAGAALVALILHPEFKNQLFWYSLAGIGLIAATMFGYRWTWRRNFGKFEDRSFSATISADSIIVRATGRERVRRWNEFRYMEESARIFLFGAPQGKAVILPKDQLNDAQISELRALIAANRESQPKPNAP